MPQLCGMTAVTRYLAEGLVSRGHKVGIATQSHFDNDKNVVQQATQLITQTEPGYEVDAVLREAGVSLSDCDAVVFGAGPGAFTGLRVACGVAQGLAWAKEKPIVAASNLEALAMKELSGKPAGTRILAAFDARMHQAYCAVYEKAEEGARLSELVPAELVNPDELAGLAESFGVALASGSGVRAFPESFAVLGDRVTLNPDATVTALDLAALGAILFKLVKYANCRNSSS